MYYFDIIKESKVNGPGNRLVLWTSGCYRNCIGCFNKDAQKLSLSKILSPHKICDMLVSGTHDGISVSGGEPFYQDKELCELLRLCKENGFNTLVFSGYTYSEIISHRFGAITYCDYLIDGRYVDGMTSSCSFTGSKNQRLLQLKDGQIIADLTDEYSDGENKTAEIFIDENGVVSTGLLNI